MFIGDLPDAIRCHCLNPPTPSDVIDWTSASHYLNHGQWLYARTLANNTRLLRLVHGHIAVRLHSSVVVVYPRPGSLLAKEMSKDQNTAALFSLAGCNTPVFQRRIMAHTPGAFTLSPSVESPTTVVLRRAINNYATRITPFGDNQIVWLDDHGGIVRVSSYWPANPEAFHPKSKRPYRTRRKRGGKKQTVAHFTGGGQELSHLDKVVKAQHLLQQQIISTETAYEIVYGGANGSADSNPPSPSPSSPQVDGETVRHQLSQAVPDMGVKVFCPVDVSEVTGGECYAPFSLTTLLIHLNDSHRWTREAIADWLEAQDLDLEFRPPPDHSPPTTYTPF